MPSTTLAEETVEVVLNTVIKQLEHSDAALLIAITYLEQKAEHPGMSVEIREVLFDMLKKRVGEILK